MEKLLMFNEWFVNKKTIQRGLFDIKFARLISDKINKEIITHLDDGSYGSAFKISGYKVMKITTDEKEAYTANMLIGENTNYLVKYDAVYEIVGSNINTPSYVLIMEYLLPIKNNKLKDFLNCFAFNYEYQYEFFNQNKFDDDHIEEFIKMYENECEDCIYRFEIFDILEHLKNIAIETKKYNIFPVDIHSGNLGFRSVENDLIYFDLGDNKNYIKKELKKIKI